MMMNILSRCLVVSVTVLLLLLLLGVTAVVQAAEGPPQAAVAAASTDDGKANHHPNNNKIYLALGDSLCSGQGPYSEPPVFFSDQGYVDLIFEYVQSKYNFTNLTKLCCSADDTNEFLNGTYDIPPSTGSYCYGAENQGLNPTLTGLYPSQMDHALEYIQQQQQQQQANDIQLITLSIGANDLFGCFLSLADPAFSPQVCIEQEFPIMIQNLQTIVHNLQTAAPGVPIIAMYAYNALYTLQLNPFMASVANFTQTTFEVTARSIQNQVYEPAHVPMVNAQDAWMASANATKSNATSGDKDDEYYYTQLLYRLCTLTGMCTPISSSSSSSSEEDNNNSTDTVPKNFALANLSMMIYNIHPNAKGYEILANAHYPIVDELLSSSTSSSMSSSSSSNHNNTTANESGGGGGGGGAAAGGGGDEDADHAGNNNNNNSHNITSSSSSSQKRVMMMMTTTMSVMGFCGWWWSSLLFFSFVLV